MIRLDKKLLGNESNMSEKIILWQHKLHNNLIVIIYVVLVININYIVNYSADKAYNSLYYGTIVTTEIYHISFW